MEIQIGVTNTGKTPKKCWRQLSIDDFKHALELLAGEMMEMVDATVLLGKSGDQVLVYFPRTYRAEVDDILEASKEALERKQSRGYSREQAFQDFGEAQSKISRYLAEAKP